MRKLRKILAIILVVVGLAGAGVTTAVHVSAKDITLEITVLEENLSTIYTPGAVGYRYGPSIMLNEDGVYEALFSSSPHEFSASNSDIGRSAADVLTYRTSSDGGKTWSDEILALIPTENSRDQFSVCDPSFVKFGEWYYAAYTSTFDSAAAGVYNHVFLARTKEPANYKSWQKWNGKGWSDFGALDCVPIIEYYGSSQYYGIGEPSIVVLGSKIHIYYTYIGMDAAGKHVRQTRLHIGNTDGELWPQSLEEYGVVMDNRDGSEDAPNIKYIDELKVFLAVNTYARFTRSARLKFMISKDGLDFTEVNTDSSKSIPRLHNSGMSGDALGHMSLDRELFVMYAYAENGKDWGKWSTAVQFFELKKVDYINVAGVFRKNIKDTPVESKTKAWSLSNINEYDEEVEDWYSADKAVDGNPETYFYSRVHTMPNYNEVLAIRTNQKSITGVALTPAEEGTCFPAKFKLQYSNDSILWQDIEGMDFDYSQDPVTDSEVITINFNQSIKAKFVRIVGYQLTDYMGLYAMQIAEFSAFK